MIWKGILLSIVVWLSFEILQVYSRPSTTNITSNSERTQAPSCRESQHCCCLLKSNCSTKQLHGAGRRVTNRQGHCGRNLVHFGPKDNTRQAGNNVQKEKLVGCAGVINASRDSFTLKCFVSSPNEKRNLSSKILQSFSLVPNQPGMSSRHEHQDISSNRGFEASSMVPKQNDQLENGSGSSDKGSKVSSLGPQPHYTLEHDNASSISENDNSSLAPHFRLGRVSAINGPDCGSNFLVAILDSYNRFISSGVLINRAAVATTGDKIYTFDSRDLKVRAQDWYSDLPAEDVPHVEVGVKEVILHPHFNIGPQLDDHKNNVAVLILQRAIDLKKGLVGRICLPTSKSIFTDRSCLIIGWRKEALGQPLYGDNVLKEATGLVYQPNSCERAIQHFHVEETFNFDNRSFICSGREEKSSACEKDNGTPLICKLEDRWYLAGLVTWDPGCQHPNMPVFYVNVASFSKWINKKSILHAHLRG